MTRINSRLRTRQRDELLLYRAEKYNLSFDECGDILCLYSGYLEESLEVLWNEVYEECYLLSRYRDILLKWDKFNYLINAILEKAECCNRKQEAVALMEQMMLRQGDFLWIEEAGCPILMYKGDETCHNVLNNFALQLGKAFERSGQEVEYFDTEQEELPKLARLMGKHFRAVIGMQTYLFDVRMEDGSFLHDHINGPKYNFVFDHPVWMRKHLTDVPKNFFVITHDMNYVYFVKKYFHLPTYLLPPAGEVIQMEELQKKYDVSFVGEYGDFWSEVLYLHAMPREIRFIANHFLLEMRKHTEFTAEKVLAEVCRKKGLQPGEEEFLSLLRDIRWAYSCGIHYYRYRTIKKLLDEGIRVDVFGNTWKNCPLNVYSNLVCHPEIDYGESLQVWQQSKLSLNIMSWHKAGFTERMANIMLCKTALVTDDTAYLHGKYVPDEDLIVFRLDKLGELPGKLKMYLEDDDKRHEIAENGWEKACRDETWDARVKEMEKILF